MEIWNVIEEDNENWDILSFVENRNQTDQKPSFRSLEKRKNKLYVQAMSNTNLFEYNRTNRNLSPFFLLDQGRLIQVDRHRLDQIKSTFKNWMI